ncbi:MAG: Panacea domain-containing protein [Crocosphaera sp.]
MVDPLEIAKYFIIRAYEDGREYQMTNMKVQKLLYYSQCLHLALYNEPLFAQEIQAWRYGPVCPTAYRFYSEFEAKQLPIPQQDKLETLTQEKKELLEEVWQYFGEYHAYYLSDMTHLEFPWKKARKGLSSYERSTNPIDLKDMQLLGAEKLLEIEKNHPHYEPIIRYLLKEAFDVNKEPQYIKEEEIDDWLESLLP